MITNNDFVMYLFYFWYKHIYIYRMSQEERSIFWEVTLSVILSKILYRVGGTRRDYRLCHLIIHRLLFADYTHRYYNRSVTNSSLTICVDHSPFPSTLLTVDYFRWRPTIHWRLSALVVPSLATNHWLTLTDCPSRRLAANCLTSPKFLS
jgi:hypothetical protein